jgi:hypothetical protein
MSSQTVSDPYPWRILALPLHQSPDRGLPQPVQSEGSSEGGSFAVDWELPACEVASARAAALHPPVPEGCGGRRR